MQQQGMFTPGLPQIPSQNAQGYQSFPQSQTQSFPQTQNQPTHLTTQGFSSSLPSSTGSPYYGQTTYNQNPSFPPSNINYSPNNPTNPTPLNNSAPSNQGIVNRPSNPQNTSQRINPTQIPSPTSLDTKQIVRYHTQTGSIPPAATTQFIVTDEGNCSPRFMRMTLYSVPASSDLSTNSHLPLGAVIEPLAELAVGEVGLDSFYYLISILRNLFLLLILEPVVQFVAKDVEHILILLLYLLMVVVSTFVSCAIS
jgi:protein transport protein SEC24